MGAVTASSARSHADLTHYGILQYGHTIPRDTEEAQESTVPCGFEMIRECDLASRSRPHWRRNSGLCRILYVTEPELFATAISTHASAALWASRTTCPVRTGKSVTILRPAEAIVRDRATVLGLRALVEQSYKALSQILEIVGTPSDPAHGQPESQ